MARDNMHVLRSIMMVSRFLYYNFAYSCSHITEQHMVGFLADQFKEHPFAAQMKKDVKIQFTPGVGLYAYTAANAIFLQQVHKDLITGVMEKRRNISVTLYEYDYKIDLTMPRECALLFIKNIFFHEMGHVMKECTHIPKLDEIRADEYASHSWLASVGGVIGHRLLNMILLKGNTRSLQQGTRVHAFLPIAHTHPSYYEREQFFRGKLYDFCNNHEEYKRDAQRMFELGNCIRVTMERVSTNERYTFTNILRDEKL